MPSYRLLKTAEYDLAKIADYTIQRFGVKQARKYRDSLLASFTILAEHPLIGSDQSHIKKNIRRHVHEHHAIYYRIDAPYIIIYRILGPGEDPLQQLIG